MGEDEIAFSDGLRVNDSAAQVLGDDQLRLIARELVRNDATFSNPPGAGHNLWPPRGLWERRAAWRRTR